MCKAAAEYGIDIAYEYPYLNRPTIDSAMDVSERRKGKHLFLATSDQFYP